MRFRTISGEKMSRHWRQHGEMWYGTNEDRRFDNITWTVLDFCPKVKDVGYTAILSRIRLDCINDYTKAEIARRSGWGETVADFDAQPLPDRLDMAARYGESISDWARSSFNARKLLQEARANAH